MGLKLSKKDALLEDHDLSHVQRYLVRYLSTSSYVRTVVSKQRRRLFVDGYDLDMSYITDRILAMSFPAERMRAVYRNPLWQVRSVLEMRHQGHYKVYNLCVEEDYDTSHFHGRVEKFPFDDNHVPPLYLIKDFCESVHSWISSNPNNVAVVHCMAGKGRTGLMVCCYLVYTGMSAEEALRFYAHKRTRDNNGVSIPSQRRYVEYWANSLRPSATEKIGHRIVRLPRVWCRELQRIRLYDTVNTDAVFFVVAQLHEVPGQKYWAPVEVVRGCCRQIKRNQRRRGTRYYPFMNTVEEEGVMNSDNPRVIAQMDTEKPVIYEKVCLEYNFDKPLTVSPLVSLKHVHALLANHLMTYTQLIISWAVP
ncbi:hypothetical protein Cgig2_025816 [Carnegiea gigantea]|uniref:phosphatidylinositol-3,4,5-trisphosphate 3-phosphatase n=1 Tax=Carnegiea gigantea TaxID=171969 RepID=A0A9Q1GXB9_9CARY|nr:hypothetical protein Cgig2_025816 [Carnegiea gigantea]